MKNIILCLLFIFSHHALAVPKIQYVILHSPGINWPEDGLSQEDRIAHADFWRVSKIVEKGGPNPGRNGGMMIIKEGQSLAEVKRLAAEDPAVKNMLLNAEVREWVVVIDGTARN